MMSFHHRAGLKNVGLYTQLQTCFCSELAIDKVWVNNGIFAHAVGTGQEYCGRIFSQPICFVMASVWTTSHTVLEGIMLRMYSQSARGLELLFLQVVCLVLFFLHTFFL